MLPERDQDILLWATLLHDIRKRGPPLFIGKDHIHPFTSAESALRFMREHQLITTTDENKRDFELMISMLAESK